MLVLTHALSGGALAQRIGDPFWGFLLGVALHIFFDKIPHFWPSTKKYKSIVMAVDGLVTALLIIFVINFGIKNLVSFLAGAFGGIIVDVLIIYTPLYKKKIGQWHTNRQIHKSNLMYYLTDGVIIVISGLLIRWFR